MANTGLKEYNTILDFNVGGLNIKLNLSKLNRDLFIASPLTLQIGRMPLTLSGNLIGAKLIKTNSGWFQPKKMMSVFTKSYGQKILMQSATGTIISGVSNIIENNTYKLIEGLK